MLPDSRNKQGFTLVEILVVILLFSVFGVAIYSLYLTHMKIAFTQEDVVDVQQNVRIAMERLTRDIMMAGFLVPPETTGKALFLGSAYKSYSSMILLRTASADATFVRLNSAAVTEAATNLGPLSVAPVDVLDRFRGGDTVRIIRALNTTQPSNTIFSVITSNKNPATITLANTTSGIEYRPGDVICKVDSISALYPETVTYTIIPCNGNTTTCLARSVNSVAPELIAQGITRLDFGYLLDNDFVNTYKSSALDDDKLSILRAVRVTITGQTSKKASPGDLPKTRQLTSIVKLRNRR